MREIEFLPEWYRKGRRRSIGGRARYVFIVLLVASMAVWEFTAGRTIANTRSQLGALENDYSRISGQVSEYNDLTNKISQLNQDAQTLNKLDQNISVAGVIAELSHLISAGIILDNLSVVSEVINIKKENAPGQLRSVSQSKQSEHTKDVFYRIQLQGTAQDAAAVAELICMLEDSSYFDRVTPVFSRDKLNSKNQNSKGYSTEFEICCYLANCTIEE